MTILRDVSIFWAMFHVIFLFLILFRSRFTRKKTIAAAAVGMGILMAANEVGLIVFGIEALAKVFLLTCSIPSFIFFYVMSANKRFRFLLSFALADTTCLWVMAVTTLMDTYLGGGKYVLLFISRLIAFPLLEYLAWRYLRKPYLELQDAVKKGWGVFAGMTILYYVLLVVVVQFPTNIIYRPEDTFLCVLVLILMLFNYGTLFMALYRQLLLYRKQQSERILQEQKNTLEAQLGSQQNIRKMRHDMKGYVATLSGLLTDRKVDEALTYLKGVEAEMDISSEQFCANPYINAVFVHYAGKFKEMEAEFNSDIQIGKEELPYMELCQILSNGLENACDALKGLEKEKRRVSVHMKYNRDYLLIQIRNRCRDDLYVTQGELPATDKEGLDHGFGLATIKEAAECLEGKIFCYTEDGDFILNVMVSKNFRESRN
ncbi:MAG: GHKL domain-containing protein [Lachnospiraceae bacterium]|nr:GHKL domain-containing protein [Lachnospiraceae bacterium]MDE7177830.1 GHKL domain-containing protein [Lachnospiraceae bacterium]